MGMKTCSKCGEELPATTEYFCKRKASKDGLRESCKKCQKEYRNKNKEIEALILRDKNRKRFEDYKAKKGEK